MSISYTILGILSYKSMTGYDIKRIIQNSSFMYWSGNNNQIYRSLTELLDKGWVTNVVKHQEGSPTKKIYTITDEGLDALKEWVLSSMEPSEIKKPFLVRLAWSRQLNSVELNELLDEYENQVRIQLLMEINKKQDTSLLEDSIGLEATIWSFINDNIRRAYENELKWIQDLRIAIANTPNKNDKAGEQDVKAAAPEDKDERTLNYSANSNTGVTYVHFDDPKTKLEKERDIIDIITAVADNNAQYVLFDCEALSKDFLELKKGLVAAMLQKFTMYNIKSAIIIKDMNSVKSEFRDAIAESKKHGVIRLFSSIAEAEKWFLSQK